MASGKFISYLRVSTARQGKSGLGLEAQREAVRTYLDGGRWKLVEEVIEVESGKRSDNRPQLAKALSLCRVHKATLVVTKLDRLARNVAFIANLMEAGVKFVAADMPEANETMLHFMSVMAQHEAKAISERTKAALAAAKRKGVLLGCRTRRIAAYASVGSAMGILARQRKAQKRADDLRPVIEAIKAEGHTSLRQIAEALNAKGIAAPQGGVWHAGSVRRILN
jgi:DNA invertase Pin-like site-specific DNA recombinase